MIGLTHSLHPSIFHYNYKISLMADYRHSLKGFLCLCYNNNAVFTSRVGFGNSTSPSKFSDSGSCWQVFWKKTRVMSGYTISIVQHNEIYQHFSSLVGIDVVTGA